MGNDNGQNRAFDLLALGEIMLRLSPPDNERLVRGETLQKLAGGSELNVVSGVSLLGLRTGVISKLPYNDLGAYIKNRIRFCGVSDDYLVYDTENDARLGIYYYENGAYPRKPSIVYDRKHSSFNKISPAEFPESLYRSARCFHTSGITLALGKQSRETAVEMIRRFKAGGALISFDVNYRANLWSEDEARACVEAILPHVDIFFCSEDTARMALRRTGTMPEIMKGFAGQYGLSYVASTQRVVHSPKLHTFGSLIYDARSGEYCEEEPYRNIDVVDRVGSGDAYISGVLYGLLAYGDCRKALEYGNATGSVKNTIPGDLPSSDLREIERIIASHHATGKQMEMNR